MATDSSGSRLSYRAANRLLSDAFNSSMHNLSAARDSSKAGSSLPSHGTRSCILSRSSGDSGKGLRRLIALRARNRPARRNQVRAPGPGRSPRRTASTNTSWVRSSAVARSPVTAVSMLCSSRQQVRTRTSRSSACSPIRLNPLSVSTPLEVITSQGKWKRAESVFKPYDPLSWSLCTALQGQTVRRTSARTGRRRGGHLRSQQFDHKDVGSLSWVDPASALGFRGEVWHPALQTVTV